MNIFVRLMQIALISLYVIVEEHVLSPVMLEVTDKYETLDILQDPAQLEKHVNL